MDAERLLLDLARLGTVLARKMFGGVGIYYNDVFFAILYRGRLYFKVDDANRPAYEAAGMGPFRPFPDKSTTMRSYYEVPVAVQADAAALQAWARQAIQAARRDKKGVEARVRTRKGIQRPAKAPGKRGPRAKPR